MSNRALRRLQQRTALITDHIQADGEQNSTEDDEIIHKPVKQKGKGKKQQAVNPFELLTEQIAEEEELEEQKEEEEEQKEEEDENTLSPDNMDSRAVSAVVKKKKKNKKKKKKLNDAAAETEQPHRQQVEDEIEASIQEVNRMLGEVNIDGINGCSSASPQFTVDMKALLNVEYKYLNAENEMRRKFGSRALQAEQGRARRRNTGTQRQGRLVQPRADWPHVGRIGVSMSVLEERGPGSGQCFRFEHSPQYQQVQFLFLDAVQSYNPQNIVNLVRDHPYHIDSLMQLSEVFHINEDAQTAVDLIERALYVFETSFHPRFNMASGNCRLDFRRQENRPFFLALFKHLTAVGKRGCHRTALELCKLLLSLDPDGDPMCVLLMIDFYALRSEQYSFLIRLFEEWEPYRNLSQLPNFAFSVPLAMFHLAADNPSLLLKADAMLQESLLMFPGLLMELLDKCGICPDKQVAAHPFFSITARTSQTPALKQLVALYVGRCYSIWKEAEVLLWLERVVNATLDLVNAKDPRVASFAEKRKVRYQGTPRNIYRHFIISDIKDATATLPPELTSSPILTYDPLPPLDAIVSYSPPPRQRQTEQTENSLGLFLRSLLPNFNAQPGEGPLQEAEGGEEARDLRRGVGALMDAMRDLLNNIRLAQPPVENGQGDQREEQEGQNEDPEEWQ